jgi:hypothetical protein
MLATSPGFASPIGAGEHQLARDDGISEISIGETTYRSRSRRERPESAHRVVERTSAND